MAGKRDFQQNIQAWFNTPDTPDNPDYAVVAYFNLLCEQGWSPKKIIGTAILALQDSLPRPSSVDQKFEEIMAAISAISETLQTAGLHLDAATQATMENFKQEPEAFGAIATSMASRYTPIALKDDDEEE